MFLRAFCGLVGVWLVAPMAVVVPMSLTNQRSFKFPPPGWSTEWYSSFFSDPIWGKALVTSVLVGLGAAAIATTLGTAASFALVRGRFRGKVPINALLLSPMVVPVVITAIGVYIVFLQWHLVGTAPGFLFAHSMIGMPFVVVTVSASLRTFDVRLERAAASLGAGPLRTFFAVTFPLIRPGILAGALFAFIASFDEVVISVFLVDPSFRTLPVQMFTTINQQPDPSIAVASTLMLVVTTVLLAIASFVQRGRRARVA